MKTKKERLLFGIVGVLVVICSFVISYSQILYSFDKMIADPLYQSKTSSRNDIKIIAIDEKTLQAYGDNKTWTREIYAELIDVLNKHEMKPAVLAFDMLYVSDIEEESDSRFALACLNSGNVVTAVNAVYGSKVSLNQNGTLHVDENYIEMVEYPYDALKNAVTYGFANTVQDEDGYIRYAMNSIQYQDETIDSFAVATYKMYCEQKNIEPMQIKTFANNLFSFTYTGKSGSYEVISLCDVLDGTVDARAFANCIVFVGVYAPGMQDAYHVPVQKGTQMYGVEIHANILESLLDETIGVKGDDLLYAVCVSILVCVFYVVCGSVKLRWSTLLMAVLIIADLFVGKSFYKQGYVIQIIELPLFLIGIYLFHLARGYVAEIFRRRKVMSAFKKYVAPQVVDEIAGKGEFKIVLGGESRNIAVLFVDIRGFTPMSEKLEPEQVVDILNEYLALTTKSIFNNGGTLDKFIGDATMAVFNAPFDLDDYIYKAVCTARDIAAGSEELRQKLMERFGRTINFGIGVNCGKAVVGNIGCEFRMDYTAIGDTVNTAARLESNAKPGQILISQDVYDAVKDRVEVTEVGVIPLKGKSNGICVYQVDKVL